ncbi:MAG: hypothetical protein HY864_08380 [Chloroflexi bacterium]|nr:hypothetical protein [Chloroflexota bacterium]
MLNLPIVMFQHLLLLFLVFFAQTVELSISAPKSGQILRGKVAITGFMDVPNFSTAELAFAYAASDGSASLPAENWFILQTYSQPVKDSALAVWDTTVLTDGLYSLRLRVFLQDGSFQEVTVANLKIGNDIPLATTTPTKLPTETMTPQPASPTDPPATATIAHPSPTPLLANPASVSTTVIYSTFARAGLVVLVLFILFSLILRLRKN